MTHTLKVLRECIKYFGCFGVDVLDESITPMSGEWFVSPVGRDRRLFRTTVGPT